MTEPAHEIHLIEGSREGLGRFEVWLDSEDGTCDGICVGMGRTREDALNDAIRDLREIILGFQAMGGE
jgi:hypothetical protein